ncbi:glycosyltransferase family 29 protein [Streptomyces sp. S9]|nr:glycosyltransferase family 29 protein [Streptomyces sp. S9]
MTRVRTLDEALRACSVHSGKLVGSLDPRRLALAEALRRLLALWAAQERTAPPVTATGILRRTKAAASGASGAGALGNDVLDALLAVGDKALACGYDDELRLAELITETILAQRRNSRAGRRLHGRVLEALGRPEDAADAYERYLGLTEEDGFGVRARVDGIHAATRARAELLTLLEATAPGSDRFSDGPATDVWADGLAVHTAGDHDGARARLVGALRAMDRQGAPEGEVLEALAQYLDLAAAERPRPTADLTQALARYADIRRNRMRGPVPNPLFGGVKWLSLGEFRNRIAGKSVCLIANSGSIAESSLGSEIDAYDLVVRFNSYRIDPVHTGRRTDIHVTIHKHAYNWEQPVDTRLVFGGNSPDWKYSVRNKLVPGAQSCVNDESLRWPVRALGGTSTDHLTGIPTSGFNMLWLLDFLDVSPTLDLIGFDFYESGAYRLPEAMKLAITNVHAYGSEKAWVMERAQSVSDLRISLR